MGRFLISKICYNKNLICLISKFPKSMPNLKISSISSSSTMSNLTRTLQKCFVKLRSSPPQVFLGKGVLKICSKFTGEDPHPIAISIKLQRNFIEIILRHGYFPVNLLQIFREPFYRNTYGGLLLEIISFAEDLELWKNGKWSATFSTCTLGINWKKYLFIFYVIVYLSLHEKCLNKEFFLIRISHIWTAYGHLLRRFTL